MRPSTNVFGTTTLLVLAALASCLAPEEGIDRTRVLGVVRVDPVKVREGGEAPGDSAAPKEMGDLGYGWTDIEGMIKGTSLDEAGLPSGDRDCYRLVSPVDRGTSTEEGAADAVTVDVLLADATATARVTVFDTETLVGESEDTNGDGTLGLGEDLDGDGVLDLPVPAAIAEADVTGSGSLAAVLTAKVTYSVCIVGLSGPDGLTYDLLASGRHPDDANVLVGLYSSDDPTDRGSLLGGTDAQGFVPVDTYSYLARYEMLFVREFQTDTDGDVTVLDENVKSGFVWAGDWSNLAQGLPAGTWYSGTPIPVDLTKTDGEDAWGVYDDELGEDTATSTDTAEEDPREGLPPRAPTYPTVNVAEPVVVDTIAPIQIGNEFTEVEPNDSLDANIEPTDGLPQDLGILAGAGFVDRLTGSIRYDGYYGGWANDIDVYKFQVPEPVDLAFTLEWAEAGADLDILILSSDLAILDFGYYGFPEINTYGTGVLEPGLDYYAVVLIYAAPGAAGDEYPYTLSLEQLGQ